MSELPFLKKKYAGGGGPIEQEREPDESSPDKLIEMVADELMDAIDKKNRQALIHALRAMVLMIQDQDDEQDEGEMS